MKKIALIAAVDENWGIGYRNELLFHLKKDMEFFREKTMGNIVVMGRKTLESFPGENPLPNRVNLVLTKNNKEKLQKKYRSHDPAPVIVESWEEGEEQIQSLEGDVFVIGGGEIYREFLSRASDVYLTRVESRKTADTYFPDMSRQGEWRVSSVSEEFREGELNYRFWHYQRRNIPED